MQPRARHETTTGDGSRAARSRPLGRTAALLGLVAALLAVPAQAAELVMVEQAGCAWCARWDREIAPAWPHSEAGRVAPLRRVDLRGPWPEDLAGISPRPRFTPTFLLVHEGREIGRIEGHPGEDFFWPMVEALIERLPAEAR